MLSMTSSYTLTLTDQYIGGHINTQYTFVSSTMNEVSAANLAEVVH